MTRLAAAAVAIVLLGAAGCAQRSAPRVADLQRAVFATASPARPQNKAGIAAQIDLARAYAKGRGTERNVEFGCGLALAAHLATEFIVQDDGLRIRTQRTVDDVCAQVADRERALQPTFCPVLGVTPTTLDAGELGRLSLSRAGLRLENASGVHDDVWLVACGDIVMSPRIVRAKAPRGSRYVPTFLEYFLWHQLLRDDGTSAGYILEWKVEEILPTGPSQADGAVLRTYPNGYIWPVTPVPRAIARGATLRQLPSGEVRWHFAGAPQFGTGTVGVLGGLP